MFFAPPHHEPSTESFAFSSPPLFLPVTPPDHHSPPTTSIQVDLKGSWQKYTTWRSLSNLLGLSIKRLKELSKELASSHDIDFLAPAMFLQDRAVFCRGIKCWLSKVLSPAEIRTVFSHKDAPVGVYCLVRNCRKKFRAKFRATIDYQSRARPQQQNLEKEYEKEQGSDAEVFGPMELDGGEEEAVEEWLNSNSFGPSEVDDDEGEGEEVKQKSYAKPFEPLEVDNEEDNEGPSIDEDMSLSTQYVSLLCQFEDQPAYESLADVCPSIQSFSLLLEEEEPGNLDVLDMRPSTQYVSLLSQFEDKQDVGNLDEVEIYPDTHYISLLSQLKTEAIPEDNSAKVLRELNTLRQEFSAYKQTAGRELKTLQQRVGTFQRHSQYPPHPDLQW